MIDGPKIPDLTNNIANQLIVCKKKLCYKGTRNTSFSSFGRHSHCAAIISIVQPLFPLRHKLQTRTNRFKKNIQDLLQLKTFYSIIFTFLLEIITNVHRIKQ